jgi:hypothetical protein
MKRFVKLPIQELINMDYSQKKRVGPFEFSLDQESYKDVVLDASGQFGTISYGTIDLAETRNITYINADTGQLTNLELTPGVHGRLDMIDLETMEEVTEEQYNNMLAAYPVFAPDTLYEAGDIFAYEGSLYYVIKIHTSSSDPNWAPDKEKSLYRLTFPENVIAEWVQPTGAHDAYNIGDRVLWNGQIYESTINANVWAPNVTGWILV